MTARTQDEIVARFRAADDIFDWAREVLVEVMTADTTRKINPRAACNNWTPWTAEQLQTEARNYLTFTIGKILDHRGLSAERSVIKLREFAWLLGRDDVVQAMDAAEYPQYGAPKVRAFAHGMGWAFGSDDAREALDRMAQGVECWPGCGEGCGR